MEHYSKIKGYSVTKNGEIYSHKSNRFLKKQVDFYGYETVMLSNKNERKNTKVHRMIAETYISNPLNKPIVNHINGVKTDNRVENLEWATHKENTTHAFSIGLHDYAKSLKSIRVVDIKNNKIYKSIADAAKTNNIDPAYLANMLRGYIKNKTTMIYFQQEKLNHVFNL